MFFILIKISLRVVRIWDFEGAIGVLNTFGHFLNHQTPKISMFLILIKISLWVVRIWDFEGAIGV
jgi:hypothetical protein